MSILTQSAQKATQKRRIVQPIFAALQNHVGRFLGAPIALAVSGGLDSRALLESVALWPQRNTSDFLILTVNHQTRGESLKECQAVYSRARALGFQAEILTLFLGAQKDEASMRNARYSAIWSLLRRRGIKVLCTAHQKDDDAEGVLMDLFGLGGGKLGSGMKSVKCDEFGQLVRPFLELERRELLLFLSSIGALDYFQDPSNMNGTCARQKARDFIQAHASKFHPRPVNRLALVASQRLQEQELITHLCENNLLSAPEAGEPFEVALNQGLPLELLRRQLKSAYAFLCPERDPRNAAPIIEILLKKATALGFIGDSGVDPSGNSITLGRPVRMNFDLPGAKALMTPRLVSLFRT